MFLRHDAEKSLRLFIVCFHMYYRHEVYVNFSTTALFQVMNQYSFEPDGHLTIVYSAKVVSFVCLSTQITAYI